MKTDQGLLCMHVRIYKVSRMSRSYASSPHMRLHGV
jgi:hypothetical protein